MFLCFTFIIKYTEENKKMNIDYIYTLLGLDFWTPQQFYFVLCTISYIELVIMLIVM